MREVAFDWPLLCQVIMKILFLIPYPLAESPSQRFRFEQYSTILIKQGHNLHFQSFFNSHNWLLFFKKGKILNKFIALAKGFIKRGIVLFKVHRYDIIFIHREAAPLGPPLIEWALAKILRKKIIFDFDDAIWLTDRPKESWILRTLKWRSKVALICRWSYKVSCGNDYLCAYALQFNQHVIRNPTTIDTSRVHNPDFFRRPVSEKITIGWTGSHSTLKYLKEFEPVLKKLEKTHDHINFLVIADKRPLFSSDILTFIPWSKRSEIEDLMRIDIGIMPLPDDEWANGKCGFKALQYMALEIPTVASPVGVNTTIIEDGVEGFLCSTPDSWFDRLNDLIANERLRKEIGKEGRKKVIRSYSVISNVSTFLSLFE